MTDTAWLILPWIILSTSFHCPVRMSNSRISSEDEPSWGKESRLLAVTYHQDLVVDIGPTETFPRKWELSRIDPG